MRFRSLIVLAAAAVVCFAAIAEAQPPGGARRGQRGQRGFARGGFGMSLMMLAQNSAVQKEIETTEEQVTGINKLAEELRGQRGQRGERPNFREMSEQEREKFFQEMRERREKQAKEANAKLGKILLNPQMKRLEEIRIQVMGLGALSDPEIAKKLKITEAQQKKMEEAMTSARDSMRTEMQELFRSGDREKIRAAMTEMRKKLEDKVLGELTSAQKAQFEKMKGKPFEMPAGGMRGGFRGQRGRPAPQGQGGRPGRPRGGAQPGN